MIWLGPLLLAVGLVRHRMWEALPWGRATELLLIGSAAWCIAKAGSRFIGASVATWLVGVWLLALAVFAGPIPVLVTALLALAAIACGSAIADEDAPPALQCALGLLLFAGVLGWLLPVRMHFGWVYLVLCLGLVLWRRGRLMASLRAASKEWSIAVAGSPGLATFAIVMLGVASSGAWLPTLLFDDLAYHLRMPWQLQLEGVYSLDPRHQVWALAPWGADVLQSLAQLMALAEARGPLNALWLAGGAAGIWRFAANLQADAASRWLSIALFGSLPLTAMLTGSMQTELPATAALAWMAAVVSGPRHGGMRLWLPVAVLAGGLAGMKLMAACMAGLLLVWALVRQPWPPVRHIVALLVLGLVLGGSSYCYASVVTGNPFLPLFNDWFKSDYFPHTAFSDPRWRGNLGPTLPWNMVFDTDRYLEAFDGGGGFSLVALSGAWLLALLQPGLRGAALLMTALLLVPLLPMQYLRYAYPGIVLLTVPTLIAASRVDARSARVVAILLCLVNVGFVANSIWTLRTGALKSTILAVGRDAPLYAKLVPERVLIAEVREHAPAAGNVLLIDPNVPYYAELGHSGRTTTWYDTKLHAAAGAANHDASGRAWLELLRQEGITEVILRQESLSLGARQALSDGGATKRLQVGPAEWWSLPAVAQEGR